jgi:hypothetical protein
MTIAEILSKYYRVKSEAHKQNIYFITQNNDKDCNGEYGKNNNTVI